MATLIIKTANTYAEPDDDPRIAESGLLIFIQRKKSIETLLTKGTLNHVESYGRCSFDGREHFHLRYATTTEIENFDVNSGKVVSNPEAYLRDILARCEDRTLREKIEERFL